MKKAYKVLSTAALAAIMLGERLGATLKQLRPKQQSKTRRPRKLPRLPARPKEGLPSALPRPFTTATSSKSNLYGAEKSSPAR